MIQPTELRSGNILLYNIGVDEDGSNLHWEPTTIDWQDIKLCTEKNKEFNQAHKPAPLTEEWLLKLGFKQVDNGVFYHENLGLEKDGGAWGWTWRHRIVEHSATKSYFYHHQRQVKFVHELQNIYFALTGEELTINPTE